MEKIAYGEITRTDMPEAMRPYCSHCGAPREQIPWEELCDASVVYPTDWQPPKLRPLYRPCGCSAAQARRKREQADMERLEMSRQEEAFNSRLAAAHVPTRFPDVPCDDEYHGVALGGWLYIHGQTGVGKTALAASVARRWVREHGNTCSFTTSVDMLTASKAALSGYASVEAAEEEFLTAELLIIDDLGKESPTAWALSRLFRIIDTRYKERRRTVITSQFKLSQLAARLAVHGDVETAKAIVSRLTGECFIKHMEGGDRRVEG